MTPLEVRGDGVTARVALSGEGEVAPITPPPVLPDVSRLPGASLVGLVSDEHQGVRTVVGCIRAPSDRWVPGLSSVVFERATPMILGAAGLHPSLERAAVPTIAGAAFAEAHRGTDGDRRVLVAHALAFVGTDVDAFACSVACSEPANPEAIACDAITSSFVIAGDLKPEPPPGLLARAVLGTTDHPVGALATGVVVALVVVATLLVTRPRLRPMARARTRRRATSSGAPARPR